MDCEPPLNRFAGIRFYLAGMEPPTLNKVKEGLVNEGAICVGKYSPDVTHVIVHELLYDDPICVAARRDQKALVTSLWVQHSLDLGEPLDTFSIMYRPPMGLNGIPGADKLIICLTGYHKQDREDIMTMVRLMGAQFSKILDVRTVTHLICYKFEGDKYVVAKNKSVKLVNNYWLEDCLRAWKILPEDDYNKSTYEVDMEAKVQDSEAEMEDEDAELGNRRRIGGFCALPNVNGKVPDLGASASSHALPLHVGKAIGDLAGSGLKRSAQSCTDYSSPSRSRKSPKKSDVSLQIAGMPDNLDKGTKGNSVPGDNITAGLEFDKVKANADCVGASNAKGLLNGSAGKSSSKSSSKSSKISSLNLQSMGEFAIPEARQQEHSVEKMNADARASNVEADKKRPAASFDIVDSALLSGEGFSGLEPQTRPMAVCPNASHNTPKSQKLRASAGKRIDATEPATPVSTPRGKSKKSSVNVRSHVDSESASALLSSSVSSAKSDVKNVTASRSLGFEKLQVNKFELKDYRNSPSAGKLSRDVSVSPCFSDKKPQPENPLENASVFNELDNLETSEFGKSRLITDDQKVSSASKPPRKKMVARKTLDSKPKVSKKKNDAKKGPLSGNLSGDDAALHPDGQTEGKKHEHSTVTGEILAPSAVNVPAVEVSNHLEESAAEIKDYVEPLDDDTEAPPDLEIQHLNSSAKISHLTEDKVPSFELLSETDQAEVTNPPAEVTDLPSPSTFRQEMHAVKLDEAEPVKPKLGQKKGVSGLITRKTVKSAQKSVRDAEGALNRQVNDENESVKKPTEGAKGKKRRGAPSLITAEETENEKETDISDAQVLFNGSKRLGNTKKRRGTLLLNKSDKTVQVEKENELNADRDVQNDGEKNLDKLPATSNSTERTVEVEGENESVKGNGQGTKKLVKNTGKKKRGTLLLNKSEAPVSVEGENLPVDGKPKKLIGSSNVTEDLGKEKDPVAKDEDLTAPRKPAAKKRRGTLLLRKAEAVEMGKENEPVEDDKADNKDKSENEAPKSNLAVKNAVCSSHVKVQNDLKEVKCEPACFILSGHRLQRKEFQQLIKRLKGKLCRDSHQWSYQATHFIVPDPIRRTEKFFAAVASGRWILKTDYLTASSQAGKFLPEEPFEWHKNGLTEDGAINLEAPRKWRHHREKTGHGAFYGMRIVVYGECIAPPLDTLKRVVKAGDGTILATSPPYTRFLNSGIDFAIVSPGMPRVDIWIQEFIRHEIPCVVADYLVEYVCKPGYPLDRHVQYNTQEWAAKSFSRLSSMSENAEPDAATPESEASDSDDLACQVCDSSDRAEVMLICGNESGSIGCGIGTHIDCCDPPLEDVPEEDWFCLKCSKLVNKTPASAKNRSILQEKMF